MKFLVTLILSICFSALFFAQKGITFQVEELSKPKMLLSEQSCEKIYEDLILKDAGLSKWDVKSNRLDIEYGILAKSNAPDSLVTFGYHSFFNGMYQAYADHRPFVISPDMMWLLISQGFARHITSNPEKYQTYFIDSKEKKTLAILSKTDLLSASKPEDWEGLFPQFTAQIASHVGKELTNTLASDFSTSTAVEKMASEITIMEAMEPYFEFVVIHIVCGIPEITLQGTPEDWRKVLSKAQELKKYDLSWWINEIEPILKEFIRTSEGKVNTKFWQNMFKYHSQKKYGAPNIIDGWIIKFFPYDKNANRNNLKELNGSNSLPEEIVKVDVNYIKTDGQSRQQTMLELWSGFIGLAQNKDNFGLTPQIGWMVRKKDVKQTLLTKKMENSQYGIDLRVEEVPEVLKKLKSISSLTLRFKKEVFIPEWLRDIPIEILDIQGKISPEETEKIIKWFPTTKLGINNKWYQSGKELDSKFELNPMINLK